jgi:uncharacterized protein
MQYEARVQRQEVDLNSEFESSFESNLCLSPVDAEVWVVVTHAAGDNEQCLALAEALGRPFRSIRLTWPESSRTEDRAQFAALLRGGIQGQTRRALMGLHAPWPRLVICSGRRADDLAFWIKDESGGRARVVTIGRAHGPLAAYDLVIVPPHYMLPQRPNVIHIPISMARTKIEIATGIAAGLAEAPKPWFTLLLGGRVKQFVASEAILRQAALRVQLAAERCGGSVIVSTSRRTPQWLLDVVQSELTEPTIYRWSGRNAANPYASLLQKSAAVFVTGDSISMIREACGSGAPTYVIEFSERLDLRRLWRRGLYRLLRGTANISRRWNRHHLADMVDTAQEWLHAARVLRYPRDLRRFHNSVYEMGLAEPACSFDPSSIPARRDVGDLLSEPGLQVVKDRCLSWLSPPMNAIRIPDARSFTTAGKGLPARGHVACLEIVP